MRKLVVKYTGLVMLFAAGVIGAYVVKAYFSKILAAEEELINLLEYIKNKIMFFREPIEEIYSSFDCKVLSETGFTEEAFENGWCSAVRMLDDKKMISRDFSSSVYDFGKKLGNSFADEEINNCNYHISRATESFEKDKTELPKKSKLYSTFCIAGALLACILIF